MSEELKKAAYILAAINQYIKLPSESSCFSTIFQNTFTSGIDNDSLKELEKYAGPNSNNAYQHVREIIKSQKWEDIFAWSDKQLNLFKTPDIPQNIKNPGFFWSGLNNWDYKKMVGDYILVAKFFIPKGNLYCKYKEEWKNCSSNQQEGMNDMPNNHSSVIMCFVKNREEIPQYEIPANKIEKEDKEEITEKIEANHRNFEGDAKNINIDQINERFKQIEEELCKYKQSNECLQSELQKVKLKTENTKSDMNEVKAMVENMNKKLDDTRIDLEKNLKEKTKESQLFIENILYNFQNNLNHLEPYRIDSTDLKNEPNNKNSDFSLVLNSVSDYFQCINKTIQDYLQKISELKNECISLIDKYNKMISEGDMKFSSLEAKINDLREKTQNFSISNGNELISSLKNAPKPKILNRDPLEKEKKGLVNIGNSCYLNSILQIFASTPYFIENIRNIESNLFKCLSDILLSITDPSSIKIDEKLRKLRSLLAREYPMFDGNAENDCKELYTIIVNLFMDATKNNMFVINKNQTIICENSHKKELPESQVFLTIPNNGLDIENWLNQLENEKNKFSGDNKLFCETCQDCSETEIVTKSIESNEILAFYNAKSKNSTKNIPYYVSLGKNQYEIFGIIWYSGRHYMAYTIENGVWNEYNDKQITKNKPPNPNNSYMLFYKKITD